MSSPTKKRIAMLAAILAAGTIGTAAAEPLSRTSTDDARAAAGRAQDAVSPAPAEPAPSAVITTFDEARADAARAQDRILSRDVEAREQPAVVTSLDDARDAAGTYVR